MLTSVRYVEELVFVRPHASVHHSRGHIQQKQRVALTGAEILGGLSSLTGA